MESNEPTAKVRMGFKKFPEEIGVQGDNKQLLAQTSLEIEGEAHRTRSNAKFAFIKKWAYTHRLFFLLPISFISLIIVSFVFFRVSPPAFNDTFQDPMTVTGKSTEAYGFLLCTKSNADESQKMMFEGLKTSIYRLKELDPTRDILVITCQLVPANEAKQLQRMGVIVVRVHTINPPGRSSPSPKWVNNFSKFIFWKLIHWERILFIDIDVFFTDNFLDLWDDPSTKIITSPPAGIDPKSTYLGYSVESLYPYLFACSHDSFDVHTKEELRSLNSGVFVVKPSIAHYNLLMDIAWQSPMKFPTMEQAELDYVYRDPSSAIPWKNFSMYYNWALFQNDVVTEGRGFHEKVWRTDPQDKWIHLARQWHKQHDAMEAKFEDIQISHKELNITTSASSVTIGGLQLTSGRGVSFYAIASVNLLYIPSQLQVKEGLDALGTRCPSSFASEYPTRFSIDGLAPDTNYAIYYFAETDNDIAKYTDVNYALVKTK